MKFPYIQYRDYYRPVLSVDFVFSGNKIPSQVLLDSGADISIMHADVADLLNIPLLRGRRISVGGIGGTLEGFAHTVDIEIGGHPFHDVPVIFTKEISKMGFGILGHRGIFDRARIVFDFRKKEFEIVPKQ